MLKSGKEKAPDKRLIVLFLALYVILLIWAIVFKCNQNDWLFISHNSALPLWERISFRLIPFEYARQSFATGNVFGIFDFFMNILCFAPIGIALYQLMGSKRALAISSCFILAIELFQLFSGWGGFDITDVILNISGVCLGLLLRFLIVSRMTVRTVNRCYLFSVLLCAPLAALAVVNTALNFPV